MIYWYPSTQGHRAILIPYYIVLFNIIYKEHTYLLSILEYTFIYLISLESLFVCPFIPQTTDSINRAIIGILLYKRQLIDMFSKIMFNHPVLFVIYLVSLEFFCFKVFIFHENDDDEVHRIRMTPGDPCGCIRQHF